MSNSYLQAVLQGAKRSRRLRLAARDLLDPDPHVRTSSRQLLLEDPSAADPVLTELVFRNRSRLSIEAACVLFTIDAVRGTYAILALCADEYMVRWYEQPLAAALKTIPDNRRRLTLVEALDRIDQTPGCADWAYALATNSVCSLKVNAISFSDEQWLRILCTPADEPAEWALWRGLISYQPSIPSPPVNIESINANGPLSLRIAAVETLLCIEPNRVQPLFVKAVGSGDLNAQAAVIYGLLRLHRADHIPLLHAIISSSRHPLQRDAVAIAKALGANVTDILTLVRPASVFEEDGSLLLKGATGCAIDLGQRSGEAHLELTSTKEVLLTTSYKLCAIDLDDTLLNSRHEVSEFTRKTVELTMQQNITVVIASGRMFETTLPAARALGITSPIICYNGAMVRSPISGEILEEKNVPAAIAAEVMDFAKSRGMQLNFYLHDHIYSATRNKWMELYQQRTGAPYEVIDDFDLRLRGERPTKLIIVDAPDTIEKLLPEMKKRFNGQITVMRSNAEYLEFLPIDANKGIALAKLADSLSIARQDTIAFGDSWNDIPMLQWAGRSVAVANAKPEVQQIADEITETCDEDGVAKALARLFNLY